MATAQRVFYETVTVLVFFALLILVWVLSGQRAERRVEAAREEQSQVLAQRTEEHRGALTRLEDEKRRAAEAYQQGRAEAVFRGYAAGLQPAAIEGWRRYLGASRDQLVRADPEVVFIHLVTPGGYVLTSTDPELTARGRLEEEDGWVLATEEVTTRPAEGGTLELAGPVLEGERPVAYLWMGYDAGSGGE